MKRRIPGFIAKPFCLLVILSFTLLDLSPHQVQAGMIGTEEVVTVEAGLETRDKVMTFLDREDVKQAMVAQGVAPAEVKMRVASLSDQELERIAADIDSMPAGAGSGTIIGAIVFVFVLLLVTDILGLTKVFPFTRPIR